MTFEWEAYGIQHLFVPLVITLEYSSFSAITVMPNANKNMRTNKCGFGIKRVTIHTYIHTCCRKAKKESPPIEAKLAFIGFLKMDSYLGFLCRPKNTARLLSFVDDLPLN